MTNREFDLIVFMASTSKEIESSGFIKTQECMGCHIHAVRSSGTSKVVV